MTGKPNPLLDQPSRLATLLYVVQSLLEYGRHLADTLSLRATHPSFTSIAVCFGTANVSVILAQVQRGILRAIALERVLIARALRGRDIACTVPRCLQFVPASELLAAPLSDPAESKPAKRTAATGTTGRAPADPYDPRLDTRTIEQFEAQIRRRPIGRTIVDICLDLGAMPGLCGAVFDDIYDAIMLCRGSMTRYMKEKLRRANAYYREYDIRPIHGWEWWDGKVETIRSALGFRIGEPPVLPPHLQPAPT